MSDTELSPAAKRIKKAMQEVMDGKVTIRRMRRPLPDVAQIRETLSMNRTQFAKAFNFSPYSVRNWELGVRTPRGPSLSLLRIIQTDPWKAYRLLHPEQEK